MRIGKQDAPYSAISTSTPEAITVRGRDLCRDVIGQWDFTSYFWLLVTGQAPSEQQLFFANAVLTAIAEHGLVPSVVASRMTYAAAPEAFQGAVAAGLLGCGTVVLGSAEVAGKFLSDLVELAEREALSYEEAATRGVSALRAERKQIPGFGHPLHAGGDPRGNILLKLAVDRKADGPHIRMLRAIQAVLPDIIQRPLPINVNGAIPAVMLDVGFPLQALKGISLLARTASLIGHLQEETERPIGFILSGKAAEAIGYDGEAS
jgi:citrate synthase